MTELRDTSFALAEGFVVGRAVACARAGWGSARVARPSAHGQAITRTATAERIANVTVLPASSHPISVTMAMIITAGTNQEETQSAKS